MRKNTLKQPFEKREKNRDMEVFCKKNTQKNRFNFNIDFWVIDKRGAPLKHAIVETGERQTFPVRVGKARVWYNNEDIMIIVSAEGYVTKTVRLDQVGKSVIMHEVEDPTPPVSIPTIDVAPLKIQTEVKEDITPKKKKSNLLWWLAAAAAGFFILSCDEEKKKTAPKEVTL